MDVFCNDAHRTSGDFDGIGNLHTGILEKVIEKKRSVFSPSQDAVENGTIVYLSFTNPFVYWFRYFSTSVNKCWKGTISNWFEISGDIQINEKEKIKIADFIEKVS